MKIDIITCQYAYNYGAVLQAYGLSQYLKNCGNEVNIINYQPEYARKVKSKKIINKIIRPMIRKIDYIKGKKVFGKFLDENVILTRKYSNIKELKDNVPEADAYICGSDQIWNCDLPNGNDDSFFLTFVPENKIKMSYAASIAMNQLNDEQKGRFKDLLKSFDYISVREKTAKNILDAIDVRDVKKVLDPVFLLEKQQWIDMANKVSKENEKYILLYCFNRQENVYEYAKKMANKKGYKIYSINTYIEDYLKKVDKYFYNVSPEKFLNLILNAEEVVTNSFHGLAFSTIFNKNVHVFQKNGGANSRMLDFLKEIGLDNRMTNGELISSNIDYQIVNEKISLLKEESYSYLNNIKK